MTSIRASLAVALTTAFFLSAAAGGEPTPPLRELRRPVEEAPLEIEEEPVLPKPVSPAAQVIDPARLCPAGAIWYMAVPDAARLNRNWTGSPIGTFANEPAMVLTLRNNRFGLSHLFGDLPASVVSAERVAAMSAILDLADVMSRKAERMGVASYVNDNGAFSFLFLFDLGLDRADGFQTMGEWETSFFLANPGSDVTRGDHSGNFIDVWNLKDRGETGRPGEIAAGFAENMFVISNDSRLAASSMALLSGDDSIARSPWGQRLAASIPSSSSADAVAFLRMDALLDSLRDTPIARNAVAAWADYLGHGGSEGEAIYYGLQFTPDGCRETYLLPVAGDAGSASLVELLGKRLKKAERWNAASIIPYHPNPAMFVGAMLEGRQLGTLLRQERRLFGMAGPQGEFEIPSEMRRIFSNEVITLLTGEMGIALFPAEGGNSSWLMVLTCNSNPSSLLRKAESTVERSSTTIYSNDPDWRNGPSWTVVSSNQFRRVTGHYLVLASHGGLVVSTLDQLLSGSSFAANKDFAQALSRAESAQGMVFYFNLPEVIIRQYPNLSHLMRSLYPRSSGLNSRPPLAMLRRYARGMLGVIAPANGGNGDFTRVTVQSPVPSMALMAGGTVLGFPRNLRMDGRNAMSRSRDNLKSIWMRLQLYSSRFGHFPDTLDDLGADLRLTMSNEDIRALLTAPGALTRMSREEAAARSYHYLSGVTPGDEPDLPIVYESQPWGEDFAGMYQSDPTRSPSESGDYQGYRQMILLDGTVVTLPEKRFQEKVLTRLAERE